MRKLLLFLIMVAIVWTLIFGGIAKGIPAVLTSIVILVTTLGIFMAVSGIQADRKRNDEKESDRD